MAIITNPQIIAFCDQRARPMADLLGQGYNTLKRFQAEWAIIAASANPIPNTADVIGDSAAVDGRKIITGAQVNALNTAINTLVTWFETGAPSRIQQIQAATVNEAARF